MLFSTPYHLLNGIEHLLESIPYQSRQLTIARRLMLERRCVIVLGFLVLLPWLAQAQTNCTSYSINLTNTSPGNCAGSTMLLANSDQTPALVQWYNSSTLVYTATSQSATSGTTVAGENEAGSADNQFNGAYGIYLDGTGALYIADKGNHRVQKWAAGATSGTTVAGGNGRGSADNQLNSPSNVWVDGSGAVYVLDMNNSRVQKWAVGATSGTTVAGNGTPGTGDDQLAYPLGLFVDATGVVYVSDNLNNRIQKWAVGAISGTTVAGTNGSSGSAANQLNHPNGVFVDASGAVYVSDNFNNRIQKWAAGATSGTTVAGGNGQGSAANQLYLPAGVYVDGAGAVYVADAGNNRIQKWEAGATRGSIVASGSNRSMVVDGSSGAIYSAANNSVQKWATVPASLAYTPTTAGGVYTARITSFNGCTATTNALTISDPLSISISSVSGILSASGADTYQWSTGQTGTNITVAPTTTTIYSVTGTTAAGCWATASFTFCVAPTISTSLGSCVGVASLSVVSDQAINRVQWFNGNTLAYTASSTLTYQNGAIFGSSGRPGTGADNLNVPAGVYVDASETIYVADQFNHRVQQRAAGSSTTTTLVNLFTVSVDMSARPSGIYGNASGAIYVSDRNLSRVLKITEGGFSVTTVAGIEGNAGSAANQLNYPRGLFVDDAGTVYVADYLNNRIQKWVAGATSGITVAGGNGAGSAANQLNGPTDVYVDVSGAMYVADESNNRIQKWASGATSGTTVAGGNGAGNAANQLTHPNGVHADPIDGIYIADTGNHRIQWWTPGASSGTTVLQDNYTTNVLNSPTDLYMDEKTGLYVVDQGNSRVVLCEKGPPSLVYTPTSAGVYTALVTASYGCVTTTNSVTLSAPPTPNLVATNQNGVLTSTLTCAQTSLTLTATDASGGSGTQYQFAGPGTSILGIVSQNTTDGTAVVNNAGVYSVTVTNASGCFSVTTITISSGLAVPSLSINPSSSILTVASPTASLSATGTGTFFWSTGETSPTISVTTSGVYSVTLTGPSGCTASTSASVAGPDLALILLLPQANFAAAGTVGEFVVNLFEVGGLPTSSGKVTITLTAPLGYTLAFPNSLTSINISGGSQNPVTVNNTQWSLINSLDDRQLTLTMNNGAFIGGGSQSSIGFQITRTNANSGSVASLTVNVADDLTMTYDGNLLNNVYARIISGL
ncbi:hypothetical protein EXU85_26305 [Spirosoma sp. KCTC 42546]|uniref:NHL repeat-containing protein n=1 Tax=Spirosoma sp. KCTC 42546 TaxID=2520506 RepID=UPI00115A2B24|nr:NHL repeat-containing protein [Spirosoma sp. KCTC 42546]QDK81931.1 hypothetical protein EXU85_26305 [Spirosoma sp. KCTC 42546]